MMSSFAHRTDLLRPSSFLSYWGRIMSACKGVRGGEVGTPFPVLYISVLGSQLLARLILLVSKISASFHVTKCFGVIKFKSRQDGPEPCCLQVCLSRERRLPSSVMPDCWQGGSKMYMKQSIYCWVDMRGNNGSVEDL